MTDPVLERRARIARLVSFGQRVGYLLFVAAGVVFAVGALGSFSDSIALVIVICLVAGSLVLAPAIVFGYAVRAAERDDRERAQRDQGP